MQNYVVEVDGYFVVWLWGSINSNLCIYSYTFKVEEFFFLSADQKHDHTAPPS